MNEFQIFGTGSVSWDYLRNSAASFEFPDKDQSYFTSRDS